MDFRQIKVSEDDFGLMTYDPAFTNTASVRSSVCYIDGEAGVLEYRGYPIEELCERSSYLEVAYLLIYGELPTQEQLDEWIFEITHHTFVHENIKKFVEGFRYDAHPMGMLLATVGALSTFYPDAKKIDDEMERHMAAVRLIAKVPTLAAFAYRHNLGLPYVYPDNELSYPGNFLSMMFKMTEVKYEPDPRLEARPRRPLDPARGPRAELLDERGARRGLVRGGPVLGGGRRRGRALRPAPRRRQRGVLRMLERIESADNIPDFLERVKNRDEKLMGFGHRVYKNFDPRANIIKKHVDEVFEVTGQEPEARPRGGAREARPRRRLLHRAQALPERRLLLGPDLRGAEPAAGHVHGDVRHPADVRLDRPVARDGHGPGDEDRPPAPDLHGLARAELRADRGAREAQREARPPRRT